MKTEIKEYPKGLNVQLGPTRGKIEAEVSPLGPEGKANENQVNEVKVELPSGNEASSRRTSSRLQNKDIPDWSYLRGKKREGTVSLSYKGHTKVKRFRAEAEQEEGKEQYSARVRATKGGIKPKQEQCHSSSNVVKVKIEDEYLQSLVTLRTVKDESSLDTTLPITKEENVTPKPEGKVKVKKGKTEQGLTLDLDIRSRKFLAAEIPLLPFAISNYTEAIHGVKVPRMFIANTYGGSPQDTSPKISPQKLAIHGFDGFIFPGADLHPLAPQVPGAPGIWISTVGGWSRQEVMRVLVCVDSSHKPPLWQYMGQDQFRVTQCLSKEEWAAQTAQVRKGWIDGLVRYRWGQTLRARVQAINTLERAPTDQEVKSYKDLKKFASAEALALALTRGDVELKLLTMRCVGYDDAFQRDVALKYPAWLRRHRRGN